MADLNVKQLAHRAPSIGKTSHLVTARKIESARHKQMVRDVADGKTLPFQFAKIIRITVPYVEVFNAPNGQRSQTKEDRPVTTNVAFSMVKAVKSAVDGRVAEEATPYTIFYPGTTWDNLAVDDGWSPEDVLRTLITHKGYKTMFDLIPVTEDERFQMDALAQDDEMLAEVSARKDSFEDPANNPLLIGEKAAYGRVTILEDAE